MPKVVITADTLPVALHLLDKWTGKLTWSLYAEKLAMTLGVDSISRHTLFMYSEIVQAFNLKKDQLRDNANMATVVGDVTIDMLLQEIATLEAKLKRLEDKNEKYKEKFVRWQYNIYMMPGVNFEKLEKELDSPLPKIDRSRK